MRKKINLDIENIHSVQGCNIERMKVYGGWLVTICLVSPKGQAVMTTTLVPDQEHGWMVVKNTVPEVKEEKPASFT